MSPRTCSHIKSNGVKCGSPALKYHTLCYFHTQWQYRRKYGYHFDRTAGYTTVKLPPLESKSSIIFAITEIQAALLDGTIENNMARTLLYGVQLAIQLKLSDEELSVDSPDTCPELEQQLREDRENHLRPPQAVCDGCENTDTCRDSSECHYSKEQIREFERIHEPKRYAKDRACEEEGLRRWKKVEAELEESKAKLAKTDPEAYQQLYGFLEKKEPQASSPSTAVITTPSPNPCHGERSEAAPRVSEPPSVSSTQPQASPTLPASALTTNQSLESSPVRECGESDEKNSPSRATARRQVSDRKLFHSSAQFARLETRALNEINILRPNS